MTDQALDAGEQLAASTSEASLRRTEARSAEIEAQIAKDPSGFRVMTGDRPTGNLHLGHYFGSLANRVRIQDAGVDTFILIADYQVITDRDGTGPIQERVLSMLADYLAIGLDPDKTTIYAHSAVPSLNQLLLPFLSLVTDAELRRNPTVKAELEATGDRPMSGLLLTYPVHQAADILFCKANLVPVGKDQLPHLEQTRVVARRFDERYGRVEESRPIFPQAEALLSKASTVLGLDGTKMSKTKGNVIEIGMDADTTARLIKKAVTDSDRNIGYDPENRPEVSNLIMLVSLCTGQDPVAIAAGLGDAGGGGLKKLVTEAVNEFFAPIRARRVELAADPGYLLGVLRKGNAHANEVGDATLTEVRAAMNMTYGTKTEPSPRTKTEQSPRTNKEPSPLRSRGRFLFRSAIPPRGRLWCRGCRHCCGGDGGGAWLRPGRGPPRPRDCRGRNPLLRGRCQLLLHPRAAGRCAGDGANGRSPDARTCGRGGHPCGGRPCGGRPCRASP
jgi:tryptophanyl-tRNA synthetase